MAVTKPYEFIGCGAMDVTKPYEFIGFGAMAVTKPYKFIGFGAMAVTTPYKFIGCGALRKGGYHHRLLPHIDPPHRRLKAGSYPVYGFDPKASGSEGVGLLPGVPPRDRGPPRGQDFPLRAPP